jgi:methylenetetrahydrofolate--tRNA-(uracil-5-)-methyltransferase
MHRNTYINSPALLGPTLQLKTDARIFFAGQISGVEGYAESIATGLIAGRNAATEPAIFPRETALGSLCHYITQADPRNFQPANITFDLLPALDHKVRDKKARHAEVCRRAEQAFEEFLDGHDTRVCCEVSG